MLKDPRWTERAKEIKDWDRGTCQLCGGNSKLQVHHLCYGEDRAPWNYPKRALVTLCEKCHKEIHDKDKEFYEKLKDLIFRLGLNGVCKSTVLSILEQALKESVTYKEGNIFDKLWCAPYSPTYWVFDRNYRNEIFAKEREREKAFMCLARKAYEWNNGREGFSEEAAINGEYYDDIIKYKREFNID